MCLIGIVKTNRTEGRQYKWAQSLLLLYGLAVQGGMVSVPFFVRVFSGDGENLRRIGVAFSVICFLQFCKGGEKS